MPRPCLRPAPSVSKSWLASPPLKSSPSGAQAAAAPSRLRLRQRPDVAAMGVRPCSVRDPPPNVSLLEVFVWFPTSEIMVLSQQTLQVGPKVGPKWGSYRGESNRI